MFKIVEFSHYLINEFYKRNSHKDLTFIDATCGMGNDSLYMASLLNNRGKIICYDIQEIAICKTKELLLNNNYNNGIYHLTSHENFLENHADLIIYNLGYLPTCDKSITTTSSTTLNSLKNALNITSNNDDYLIIIVIYPGHEEGKIESELIDNYCYNLPSNKYLVCKYLNYNRPTSPYIITISKNKNIKASL